MTRVVSLFLPSWSTDRLRRKAGDAAPPAEAPLVLIGREGNRRVVLAANAAAVAAGLRPGSAAARDDDALGGKPFALRLDDEAAPLAAHGRHGVARVQGDVRLRERKAQHVHDAVGRVRERVHAPARLRHGHEPVRGEPAQRRLRREGRERRRRADDLRVRARSGHRGRLRRRRPGARRPGHRRPWRSPRISIDSRCKTARERPPTPWQRVDAFATFSIAASGNG